MHDGIVRTIHEVRHVKGLKKNLLSLGQLDYLGCKSHTENGIMKIVRGVLVVMKAEKIAANLYMLKVETLQESDACVASSNHGEETTMMWHHKLGHISEQENQLQRERDDITSKEISETTEVQVEDNPEQENLDSSEATPEHEVQESVDPKAIEARRSTRERRPPA
ncbi:hypothetical protein LWI28_028701 [Acer negundo]|uniref:GAG-pre-integrase domain-containing protein n=1 Tax=Acer negundo TaxID=4023 RepID=A0AAD5P3H6_ACENE|nr:hypothetical protein LWI28_028701 [Acer negundo]